MASPDQDARLPNSIWASVSAIAAIGAIARFYHLDAKGLWLDEIYSVVTTYRFHDTTDLIMNFLRLDVSPPLYYLLLTAWTSIGGYSELWVRIPSAIASTVSVIAAGYVAWRAFGATAAAAMVLVTALSWPLLYYAQEARAYALMFLLSTFVLHVWLGLLRDVGAGQVPRPRLVWFTILGVTGALLHIYCGVLAGFCFVYAGVLAKKSQVLSRIVPYFATFILIWAAWLAFNITGFVSKLGLGGSFHSPPGLGFFVDIGAFAYHHPVPAILTLVLPLLLGGRGTLVRLRDAISTWKLEDPLFACVAALVVPFVAMFLVSQVQPMMLTRHLMALLPAGLLVVAASFAAWRPASEIRGMAVLIVASVVSLYWLLPPLYEQRHRPQTREAVEEILAIAKPNERVLVPCQPEWIGGCNPSDPQTGSVNPRLSRYLHYLNHKALPAWPQDVVVYQSHVDLVSLIEQHRSQGVKRVHFVGARGQVSIAVSALDVLESRGFECSKKRFFMAIAGYCELSR